jgi:hypothetical protein
VGEIVQIRPSMLVQSFQNKIVSRRPRLAEVLAHIRIFPISWKKEVITCVQTVRGFPYMLRVDVLDEIPDKFHMFFTLSVSPDNAMDVSGDI